MARLKADWVTYPTRPLIVKRSERSAEVARERFVRSSSLPGSVPALCRFEMEAWAVATSLPVENEMLLLVLYDVSKRSSTLSG